ncbi:MAG: polyphosphate kinase 2 family protein [Propioniciclava sp.]
MAKNYWKTDPRDELKAGSTFDVAALDRRGKPGWDGTRSQGEAYMAARGRELSDLQEKLFAEGRSGGERSVLLVLQGLDTAGKGGIVRHVMGMVDPQGVKLASFGVPTAEERAHHYLWRIEKQVPPRGRIGVFDRSHYEDVLVVRVDELVPQTEWEGRYDEINAWEEKLIASGTTIVKVALMVSYDEQGARLAERLDRPDKHWKFSPSDITTRSKWPAYQQAYADVFARTSTEAAPWYVVPADRKWYARLAVTEILTRTLESFDLGWPVATFDVADMVAALAHTNQASV